MNVELEVGIQIPQMSEKFGGRLRQTQIYSENVSAN